MKSILRWVLRPFFRAFLRLYEPGNDWEEVPVRAPAWRFGRGSRNGFSWYFEGESAVSVQSVDEVVAWLTACEYVSDKELFQEDDFWQHPRTLERLRRGDCEDFALWGWRKLNELGLPARLFVGKAIVDGVPGSRSHAWVVFDSPRGAMILETTHGSAEHAVRPLDEARGEYRPHFSVDGSYRTTSYSGWLTSAKEEEERKRMFGSLDVVDT